MTTSVVKNLSAFLIPKKGSVPAFALGDTTYFIRPRVPATALVALAIAPSAVIGMRDYILECLARPDQRTAFIEILADLDSEGLGEIITEIVSVTTPLETSPKPSD